jgi:hypothetical protein
VEGHESRGLKYFRSWAWANVNGVISMAGSLARHISAVASQSELELSPTKPHLFSSRKRKKEKVIAICNVKQCKVTPLLPYRKVILH